MSGPVCPDCGQPLDKICAFCGWSGDVRKLPRKELTPGGYEELAERLAKKKAGELFVVVIEATDAAIYKAMDLLGASSAAGQGRRHRLQLTVKPSKETLEAVGRLRGVRSVRLA